MNRPYLIGICPDNDPSSGLGHVSRCSALASALSPIDDLEPVIIVEPESNSALFENENLRVVACDMEPESLSALARKMGLAALITDSYRLPRPFYRKMRRLIPTIPLLVLDDDGEKADFPVTGFINFSFGADAGVYPEQLHRFSAIGSDFFPLRPVFSSVRLKPRTSIPDLPKSILITMGASDPDCQSIRLVRILRTIPGDWFALVIIGPYFPLPEEIENEAEQDPRISTMVNPDDLPTFMAEADLVINGGGVTSLEVMALGTPSIVLALAENLVTQAETARNKGALDFIGRFDLVSDEKVASALEYRLNNKKGYRELTNAKTGLVDMDGARRLAEFIIGVVDKWHRDPFSVEETLLEYLDSSEEFCEYEKLKWGSEAGMKYRFELAENTLNWACVKSWLDVGCGTGAFFKSAFGKVGADRIVGIDFCRPLLEYAARSIGKNENIQFIQQDLLAPVPGEPFDAVTCIGVLQKCGVPLFKAVARLAELTAPGGQVFITTKHRDWNQFQRKGYEPYPYHHWFRLEDLKLAFELAGLKILHIFGFIAFKKKIAAIEDSNSAAILAVKEGGD